MSNPKVSIILPAYNVEKYLHQCLDSIAKQTYKNIEVIIIIDGATDHSYEIAKQFCSQDSRFHVYWQENAGSGPARNHGLERATGELIMFVDPDDWCKPEYVEKMVSLQQEKDYDLVTAGETTVFFDNHENIKKMMPHKYVDQEYLGQNMVRNNYAKLFELGVLHAPHCKVYKTNIIKQNKVSFPDLRRSQDIVFNYRYYNYTKSVSVADISDYMYRVLSKERTLKLKSDYYKTISLIYSDLKQMYSEWACVFPTDVISTVLYGAIYALFESYTLRGMNFKCVLEDKTIKEIIMESQPQKRHLNIVKHLVLAQHFKLAYCLIRTVYKAKSVVQ